MGRMKTGRWLAAAAAAVLLSACGAGTENAEGTEDKAGGERATVTLRIATNDSRGFPGANQVEHFAAQVDERSQGRLRIEPVWRAAGRDVGDWDQEVARAVAGGEYELGMIPARTWDTEGVSTMRALNAPMLVTSQDLMNRIVTDELASDLLAGLEEVGVTGLGLYPEGIRRLFYFNDATEPTVDLAGGTVRAPTSETVYATLEALGGVPDDLPGTAFDEAFADGSVVAAESSFYHAGNLPGPTTAFANLPLFAKVNSLVINSEVFDGLGEEQRTILQDAARETVDWTIAENPVEEVLTSEFCANGGTVVRASASDVAAAEQAVQPVYDELAQDEAVAAQLARIEDLRAEVTPVSSPGPAPCGAPEVAQGPLATGEGEFPVGVYRGELAEQTLLDAGVDKGDAAGHAGTWTLTFGPNGSFSDGDCPGAWIVEEGRVIVTLVADGSADCRDLDLFSAGWRIEGDGLQLLDVVSGGGFQTLVETIFEQPFTRAA